MRALAFDTETGGLDWFEPADRAFLITWADADGTYYAEIEQDEDAVSRFINDIRQMNRGDRLWGHNLKFDLHHVRAATGFDVLEYAEAHGIELWDTHSVDQVLHPEGQRKGRGGHGLKALDKQYLDGLAEQYDARLEEIAKDLGISLKSTPHAYRIIWESRFHDEMLTYARQDARSTYDLGEHHFIPQLREAPSNLQRVVQLEREVMPVIYLAERRGVALDTQQVQAFKAQFEAQERELRERLLTELGGVPESESDYEDNLLDGKGSKRALVEALQKVGVPLTDRTDNGELSTSKAALAPLAAEYPVIADLFEWRRVRRFLNTYIGPMVGREVIHTDFQQQEAWTGRMSSRRPNMQNWPQRAGKEVRNVLVARPGYRLLVADYSQMEAMILARYFNAPSLIEAINNGLDMNAYTAALIWGGDPEDWSKHGPKAEGEQSRKTARHTFYATMYGAGAGKVTQQLPFLSREPYYELDADGRLVDAATGRAVPQKAWKGGLWPRPGWQYDEARALQRKIKNSLPGYKSFLRRLERKIDEVGYVNTYYGRQNPVSPDKKYVAVAAIVQGTGADVLKLAAVRARRALEPYGAQIVMFAHDELVAEAPKHVAEEALAVLVEAMEGAAPDHNPHFRASGHVVTHYGED